MAETQNPTGESKRRSARRELIGIVTSDKMQKTVVVAVTHRIRSASHTTVPSASITRYSLIRSAPVAHACSTAASTQMRSSGCTASNQRRGSARSAVSVIPR